MTSAPDPNVGDEGDLREITGYRVRRSRPGAAAGATRLGASVWEIEPGQAAYPYHFHYVDEELIVVLAGRPLLRDAQGWRRLEEGAVVAFPTGKEGGHQLVNDGDTAVRVLSVSTAGGPEVVVYPEMEKLVAFAAGPGAEPSIFPLDAAVPFDPAAFPTPSWPEID